MNPDVASGLINAVSYKPGWTFNAEPYVMYHNTVQLTVSFDAPDSNGGDGMFLQQQVFFLHVNGCDSPDDLYSMVIECIHHFEIHEMREFFAIDENRTDKPFHAHTSEGIEKWRHRRPLTTQNDLADVTILVFA